MAREGAIPIGAKPKNLSNLSKNVASGPGCPGDGLKLKGLACGCYCAAVLRYGGAAKYFGAEKVEPALVQMQKGPGVLAEHPSP